MRVFTGAAHSLGEIWDVSPEYITSVEKLGSDVDVKKAYFKAVRYVPLSALYMFQTRAAPAVDPISVLSD